MNEFFNFPLSLVFRLQNKRRSWCAQCSVKSGPTVCQPAVYFPIPIYPNLSPRTLTPLLPPERICFPKWNSEVGDTPPLFTYSYALLWWADDVFCQFKRWIMAGIYQGRPDNGAGPRRHFTRSDWLDESPATRPDWLGEFPTIHSNWLVEISKTHPDWLSRE